MYIAIKRRRTKVAWAYFACVLLMILIIIVTRKELLDSEKGNENSRYTDISDCWTDEEGNKIDFEYIMINDETSSSIFCFTIPDFGDRDEYTLVFRSQDVYCRVWVERRMLYETPARNYRFIKKAPGNRWNYITVSRSDVGKVLKLAVTPTYYNERLKIDHVYFGDSYAISMDYLRTKLPAFIFSLCMLVIGIMLMLLDFPINYGHRIKNHNAVYLGLFSFFVGGWSIIQTNVLQMAAIDPLILQTVGNMFLVLSAMPMILFADCNYHVFRMKWMRILCLADLAFVFICIVLTMLGLSDFMELLNIAVVLEAAMYVLFLTWLVMRDIKLLMKGRGSVTEYVQLLGIGLLCITMIIEVFRFYAFGSMDRAYVLRYGLLIFILCFGVTSMLNVYKLVSQGKEYDNVHRLAYSDALTKLGNRVAYLEKLEQCVNEKKPYLGIVYLDINNLKKVNDTLGHDVGDELICTAAEIIASSFGVYGQTYRIGGDEFCVLIPDKAAKEYYKLAEEVFRDTIDNAKSKKNLKFDVEIAEGFDFCKPTSKEIVEEAVKNADTKMYRHKARLKAMQ